MRKATIILLAACAAVGGCDWARTQLGRWMHPRGDSPGAPAEPEFRIDPLPVQQARAYGETVTGIFASLADFEDTPTGEKGHSQVADFSLEPVRTEGWRKFVVNVTRTGVGALEVGLPAGSDLVFRSPHVHDLTGYKLLSMALYSRSLRDDLRVTLVTDGASWHSQRTLVQPGWNNVLIDIQRLMGVAGFDITGVRAIRLTFADAVGTVWFNLDDVMVIDNSRAIEPVPPGLVLRKNGLDYALKLPGRDSEIALAQSVDGLWRLGDAQPHVRLAGPGEGVSGEGECLEPMGSRRVGQVELLEHNRLRMRLANTWYFPARAGEWASLAVRQIRWEHTFYGDGRWVTEMTLNNAGGQEISSVEIGVADGATWAGGERGPRLTVQRFGGSVGRWRWLVSPPTGAGAVLADNYLRPGRLEAAIAEKDSFAPGDAERDGFDESQGCFYLGARAGQCRFTILPPAEGLCNPAFVIAGGWLSAPQVSSEGLAIRPVARREDGSAVFVLPGLLRRPTAVEVTGMARQVVGR